MTDAFARVLEAEVRARNAYREYWLRLFTITTEDVARYEADLEREGLECPWKQRGDDLDRWLDDGGR